MLFTGKFFLNLGVKRCNPRPFTPLTLTKIGQFWASLRLGGGPVSPLSARGGTLLLC